MKTHHIPLLRNNVETTERVVSALYGSALLYDSIANKKGLLKGIAGGYLLFRGATGYCAFYDVIENDKPFKTYNVNIRTSVTVDRPISEVYAFWRRLENLPLFMKHLHSIEVIDDKMSHWKANFPGGIGTIEWKSIIVCDEQNERIGWSSLANAPVKHAGNVRFKDCGAFGTEVHAVISYHAPAGKIGEGIGRLLNPLFENVVKQDIQNVKKFMECNAV